MGPPVISFCMCGFSWFILQYIRPFCKYFLCKAEKERRLATAATAATAFSPSQAVTSRRREFGIRNLWETCVRAVGASIARPFVRRPRIRGRFVNRPYGEMSVHTVGATLVVARWSDMGACRRAIRESPLRGDVRLRRRGGAKCPLGYAPPVGRTQAHVGGAIWGSLPTGKRIAAP